MLVTVLYEGRNLVHRSVMFINEKWGTYIQITYAAVEIEDPKASFLKKNWLKTTVELSGLSAMNDLSEAISSQVFT